MLESFNKDNTKTPKKKLVLISVIAAGVPLIAILIFIGVFYQYLASVDQNISRGQRYLLDKKYDQAISIFLKAIRTEYNNIPARLGLGKAYIALNQYNNAETHLLKALDIDPQNKDIYIALQDLYALSDDHTKMAEILETMRHIGLEHSIIYGVIFGKLGDGAEDTILPSAQITLKSDQQDIKTLPSDQNGMYLAYLRQNIVSLTIEKDNYQPYTQQIEIRPNQVLYMPTIVLSSVSNVQNAESGPVQESPPTYLPAATDFTVTYDFGENGGTSATKASDSLIVGKSIDLTPEAAKQDWDFVGWNTNRDAETPLISLPMIPDNVTLYAIYEKTLTTTFIDYDGTTQTIREELTTLYNKATETQITLPEQNTYTDWTSSGWVSNPSILAPGQDPSTSVTIDQNSTFYGIYKNQFTLTYVNGGSPTPPRESKIIYVNSSDIAITNKPFMLASPGQGDSTFAGWALDSQNGYVYQAGVWFGLPRHVTLYGTWQ